MEDNAAGSLIKILFVDDEKNVLRSLRRLFMDKDDYELFFANNGQEGLEVLAQEKDICVVVSDYRMPEMNGVEFLSKVHENYSDTIRIVLSGYADTVAVVEAINIGCIYKFIPKPWNDDELVVNIDNAVETYLLNQQNIILTRKLAQSNEQLHLINVSLEEQVQQRTHALELRSQVLQIAQDLLDSIPVAVLGIDNDDQLVQANERAHKLFAAQPIMLGEKANKSLPLDLLAFLEQVKLAGAAKDQLTYSGQQYTASGNYINDDHRRGVVVVLVPKFGEI